MTHLLNIDPPDHTRLRRLVSKAFTPRRVAEFTPRVQELTDHLIDQFVSKGRRTSSTSSPSRSPSTPSARCSAYRARTRTTSATGPG